jgi:hypothetical protein
MGLVTAVSQDDRERPRCQQHRFRRWWRSRGFDEYSYQAGREEIAAGGGSLSTAGIEGEYRASQQGRGQEDRRVDACLE